ncbi:MAG: hypothetical protein ABI353_11135 [Isosphaeraceae bacterium]
MSGPIIRKYGFANFEKIFGPREIQHGVDEPDDAATPADPTKPPASDPAQPSKEAQNPPTTGSARKGK